MSTPRAIAGSTIVGSTILATLQDQFSDLADTQQFTRFIVRLILAVLLGAVIGFERERHAEEQRALPRHFHTNGVTAPKQSLGCRPVSVVYTPARAQRSGFLSDPEATCG